VERDYVVEEWKDFVSGDELKEFGEMVEAGAAEALIDAKRLLLRADIHESGLDRFSSAEELLADRGRLLEIAAYFSRMSVSSSTGSDEDGLMFLEYHAANTGLLGPAILIDLAATLHHISFGFPLRLSIFVDEDNEDFVELAAYIAHMFDDVVKCDIMLEDDEGDEVPFMDEFTGMLNALVCKYAEDGSPESYGDIISLLLYGFCEHRHVMVPSEFDEGSALEMPYSFTRFTAEDGRKFIALATRPKAEHDETSEISLPKLFAEFAGDAFDGLVINPFDENIIISDRLIKAALRVFNTGAEYGKTEEAEKR